MHYLLLLALLGLAHCQVYTAVTATRERTSLLGPFKVADQSTCELACNCARGDARIDCAQFIGVVNSMNCLVYYYTPSFCSFLGDYTVNTCIAPIVEHQLDIADCSTGSAPSSSLTGIWSEWTTTGACATTCGSCSAAPRKRTCTNKCGDGSDCQCRGLAEDSGPCGTSSALICPLLRNRAACLMGRF